MEDSAVTIAQIRKDRESPSSPVDLGGFYLFMSFDLVNSTRYKSINIEKWPLTISKFYEFIEHGTHKRFPNAHVWKYIGDELLLYHKIERKEDLFQSLKRTWEILQESINYIYKVDSESKTVLSIKATVWTAPIVEVMPQDLKGIKEVETKGKNIIFVKPTEGEGNIIDFLGPDVDVGFRVSKYATRGRLVVGADLAFIMFKERSNVERIEEKLKIVSYETLKGVWNGRHYPVIWYDEDWDHLENKFLYDERFDNKIIETLLSNPPSCLSINFIEKIFKDIDRSGYVDDYWSTVRDSKLVSTEFTKFEVPETLKAEVHCLAIVFNENNEILVGKRSSTKRRFPDAWEFGCGQIELNESFEDCLNRAYKDDFDIELNFGRRLSPIGTYLIEDDSQGRKIPGIIFIAKATGTANAKAQKHSKIQWADPDTMQFLAKDKTVPDFLERAELAREFIKSNSRWFDS